MLGHIQESAFSEFKARTQRFANFLTKGFGNGKAVLTDRQSQKLFVEHFTRRLIVAHKLTTTFTCMANPSQESMINSFLTLSHGHNGGHVPGADEHECEECTHEKRYASDNSNQPEGSAFGVVGGETNLDVHAPVSESILYQSTSLI